jgi:chromosome partitioning protein
LRSKSSTALAGKIVAVLSPKGGQGKSTFAKELAWLLDAVLVDLDWDGGRVSRLLGHVNERYRTVPLLDALFDEQRRLPHLYRMKRRPDMVAGHKDFEPNQPEPEHMAELLLHWTKEWNRPVVIDTHPGGSSSTIGAAEAADLIVMPVILGTGELDAVEESLDELGAFPLLLVPNKVSAHLPAAESRRLLRLADRHQVWIAETFVRQHTWMTRRKARTVVAATPSFGAPTAALTTDMAALAEEVVRHAS